MCFLLGDSVTSVSNIIGAVIDRKYKLNSDGEFFYTENYLKIHNTDLPADEVARKIVDGFGFSTIGAAGYSQHGE